MKKLILLALTAIMMVGCKYENGSLYTTKTLDSCEYIISGSPINYTNITHKGNCKYCQERMKKMIKEVKNEWMDNNKSMGHRW